MFLDETNKKIYKKSVDASGSAIIESLSYTVDEEEKPKEYVTKEEFEAFKANIRGLRNEQQSIENNNRK